MATISITTNLKDVLGQVTDKIKLLLDPLTLLKPAAQEAISLIHPRIHVNGIATDGGQIGLYSPGYLAIRSGVFQNTQRISRGVNKGKPKKGNAGTFTDATIKLNKKTGVFSGLEKVGLPRPVFNRGTDPKVIISLTRELESDYVTVPIDDHSYGVSFNNPFNLEKAANVERIYNKKIFPLTTEEEGKIGEFIQDLVNTTLHD